MKCSNLAFNTQGSRVMIAFVKVGASENICSSSGDAQGKWKTGWNSV